jgi:hypothetical protein
MAWRLNFDNYIFSKIYFQWFGQKNGSELHCKTQKIIMTDIIRKRFGLLGKILVIHFRKDFTYKFKEENLENCSYENFDIQDIIEF